MQLFGELLAVFAAALQTLLDDRVPSPAMRAYASAMPLRNRVTERDAV